MLQLRSQKGKLTLIPPKFKPDNIHLHVKIYKFLLDWANFDALLPWPAGWASLPAGESFFLGTDVGAPSFPALAPLNLHPQWIIKPAMDELTKSEGPRVFLLKSLKYLKRHSSKTWNMIIWQQAHS